MTYVIVVILVVLMAVGVVLWLIKWTATTKDWCVMMYFVAQHQAELDAKLQQVIDELWKMPCGTKSGESSEPAWEQVHVVYRALWHNPAKAPETRVVHWRPGAPKNPTLPGATVTGDLTADLHDFFDWTYATCPARHYAVFFWGHSFGPGGIFEVNQPVIVDAPPAPVLSWQGISLPAMAQGLARIVERRKLAFQPDSRSRLAGPIGAVPPFPLPPPPPPTPTPPGPPPPPPPAPPAMKVEVVLFQDCWMSTLETMYTLEDTVQYVIGSQSLVPIGLDNTGAPVLAATWPYRKLIDSLLTKPQFADDMLDLMHQYFDASPANRYPNPSVPGSLLDLGLDAGQVSATLTAPFQQLVTALEPIGIAGRKQLIALKAVETGRFFHYVGKTLRVGEVALIDVITLCDYLNTTASFTGLPFTTAQIAAIQAAAVSVRTTLLGDATHQPLVRDFFESVDPGTSQFGFKGVSVLFKGDWWPELATLMNAVSKSTYDTLAFAKNARVPPMPPPPAPPPPPLACWTVYAFEHSRSDTTGLTCL
jgi:hypothetical protein